MAFVYIVKCKNGTFYVGSTVLEPEARVWEHNHDEERAARYTIKRRPVVLVYTEEFDSIDAAFRRERQLHGWSGQKRLALIEGRISDLIALSRRRT